MSGVLLVANDSALVFSDRLCRGLSIADEAVGGMSVDEAEKKVAQALERRKSNPLLVLRHQEKKWLISWDVIRGNPDPRTLVRRAFGVGRTGNLLERIESQYITAHGGKTISLGLIPDLAKLRPLVEAIASSLDREPLNASLTETAAGVRIEPAVTGIIVDVAATLLKAAQAITSGTPGEVSIVAKEIKAPVQTIDLQGIDGLLASFSTTYDPAEENRIRNMELAALEINGAVIKSGETFSFNDRVGLRLPERGYRKAPALTSAGVVSDWGGGVCQVSSTLYNAALLAGFTVVERSPHFQPPVYVPVGLDATVADGQIDLKLQNGSAFPAYIKSRLYQGKLEIRIYGKRDAGKATVKIETTEKSFQPQQTLIVQDDLLPLGQERVESEGRPGLVVTVQRVRMEGTREISRETISTDEFSGTGRVIRVGTRVEEGSDRK